jgi:hypothetical protein
MEKTLSNLEILKGKSKGQKRRKSLLDSILINYGVKIDNDEL